MNASEAYAVCREIARAEAKNFYWAFRVLPRDKSDAMCAVYAFMRHADDLSDDESRTIEQRRLAMEQWCEEWRASAPGTSNPVFVALRDTQQRFGIPDRLLEELVEGTMMDLLPGPIQGELRAFATDAELDRYCYLVASVVGLVCIRIFGYSDPQAEKLAEETGIAFQLTNILRDIREDLERGRLYLPLDLLASTGTTPARLRELAAGDPPSPGDLAPLNALADRAKLLYRSADRLIPLLSPDSRASMWTLATIYRWLLLRIDRRPAEVFRRRVRISTGTKLLLLAGGAGRAVWYRTLP